MVLELYQLQKFVSQEQLSEQHKKKKNWRVLTSSASKDRMISRPPVQISHSHTLLFSPFIPFHTNIFSNFHSVQPHWHFGALEMTSTRKWKERWHRLPWRQKKNVKDQERTEAKNIDIKITLVQKKESSKRFEHMKTIQKTVTSSRLMSKPKKKSSRRFKTDQNDRKTSSKRFEYMKTIQKTVTSSRLMSRPKKKKSSRRFKTDQNDRKTSSKRFEHLKTIQKTVTSSSLMSKPKKKVQEDSKRIKTIEKQVQNDSHTWKQFKRPWHRRRWCQKKKKRAVQKHSRHIKTITNYANFKIE
jgi:hypothetical protein